MESLKYSRKALRLLLYTLNLPIAIVLLLIILALRPWLDIRVWAVRTPYFGHFGIEPEIAFYELCRSSVSNKKQLVVVGCPILPLRTRGTNRELVRLRRRQLLLLPFSLGQPLIRLVSNHFTSLQYELAHSDLDVGGLLNSSPPSVVPRRKTTIKGFRLLETLGLGPNTSFVLLNVRDSSDSDSDSKRTTYRDAEIETYIEAVNWLNDSGRSVIRVGSRLPHPVLPGLVSYSIESWSPELDIFLAAHCEFIISTQAGFDAVTTHFRKPILYTNNQRISRSLVSSPNSLHIYKQHVLNQHTLTQSQIWELGASALHSDNEYLDMGISLVNNTATEIVQATRELVDRLEGRFVQTPYDVHLQNEFRRVFQQFSQFGPFPGIFKANVSIEFLRRNLHWCR